MRTLTHESMSHSSTGRKAPKMANHLRGFYFFILS